MIGANWGQTHVRALRQHGVDIVALCGAPEDHKHTTAVAAELGIEQAVADPSRLLKLDLDLVTVASPARSHAPLIELLAELPILCEKPLLGMTGDPRRLPGDGACVWVNYAFTFLDSARRMAELAGALGGVRAARVASAYDLPLSFTPGEWVFEVASHPLSFAVHVVGPAKAWRVVHGSSAESATVLAGLLGDVPAQLVCTFEPGLNGLRHDVSMDTEGGRLELTGRYEQGRPWRFGPLRLNGEPVEGEEGLSEDCWLRANTRSIGTALRAVRDELRGERAARVGLFSLSRALSVEQEIRRAL